MSGSDGSVMDGITFDTVQGSSAEGSINNPLAFNKATPTAVIKFKCRESLALNLVRKGPREPWRLCATQEASLAMIFTRLPLQAMSPPQRMDFSIAKLIQTTAVSAAVVAVAAEHTPFNIKVNLG